MTRLARFARLALLALLVAGPSAVADDVHVAVASSFAEPLARIAARFEGATGHRVLATAGATGKLVAQISNGAPFDVFLAADDELPARLERSGHAVAGTRFTYAIGRLVLWSPTPGVVDDGGAVLRRGAFRHLAVANPKGAPYGAAAVEVMTRLGLLEALRPKWVLGESVAQAFQFVATGNAELGFVALSHVTADGKPRAGSRWLVPDGWHRPLRHDAVVLAKGRDRPGPKALLEYLARPEAAAVIASFGYGR